MMMALLLLLELHIMAAMVPSQVMCVYINIAIQLGHNWELILMEKLQVTIQVGQFH